MPSLYITMKQVENQQNFMVYYVSLALSSWKKISIISVFKEFPPILEPNA